MNNKEIILAPAKINLSLDILNKRDDGYHNVEMIMQTVTLYDKIIVSQNNTKKITIKCTHPYVPTDQRNLVYKATEEFFKELKLDFTGVNIIIKKFIPVQAGLAGGSTDCAATLIALRNIFSKNTTNEELAEIGKKLGSDVPFCIYCGTMLATDTGTTLTKLPPIPNCKILLIKPPIGVSTSKAYALADQRKSKKTTTNDQMIQAIKNNDLNSLCSLLHNDFEQLLELNEINKIKNELIELGAINSCMSGSGPTVYGIFNSDYQANYAYDYFKNYYKDVFLCKPCKLESRYK